MAAVATATVARRRKSKGIVEILLSPGTILAVGAVAVGYFIVKGVGDWLTGFGDRMAKRDAEILKLQMQRENVALDTLKMEVQGIYNQTMGEVQILAMQSLKDWVGAMNIWMNSCKGRSNCLNWMTEDGTFQGGLTSELISRGYLQVLSDAKLDAELKVSLQKAIKREQGASPASPYLVGMANEPDPLKIMAGWAKAGSIYDIEVVSGYYAWR